MRYFKARSFFSLAFMASCAVICVTATYGLWTSFVSAQETPVVAPQIPDAGSRGPSGDVKRGPTAEQIAAFEREQGAPIDAFNQQSVEPPAIPEPETIPDDIKKLVPEKELIDLYCAMTKWKSGDFYLAMDALKKNLVPAIEQARTMGVDLSAPDVDSMKAEGTKRINAICNAKTIADAEQQAKDFAQWGRESSLTSMQGIRGDMETKMKGLGDGIREKVTTQLMPFIDELTAQVEPEIRAQAEAFAQEYIDGLDKGPGAVPPTEAQVTAYIESRLQPIIAAKQTELEAKVKDKANEIVAPEKKKLEDIGKLFEGMDKKINDAIKAGAGRYDAEKKKAIALRHGLMVKVLDANIAEAVKHLEANATDIDNARKANPSVKSVADMKAELLQDKKDVVAKMDQAMNNDDEQGVMNAITEFGDKWQKVQQQAQDAAAQSVTEICATATPEFASAKQQLAPGIQQIQDLLAQCAGGTDPDCVQVNAISDRLTTVSAKMTDMSREMDLAVSLCQSGSADPNELIALLQKIQQDGQDAQVYSDALDAEKNKIVVNSVKSACQDALPQLQAARVELQNNDLVVLKNKLSRCAGKTDIACTNVNALSGKIAEFQAQADAFIAKIDQANALCKNSKTDADFEKVFSTLSDLNQEGNALRLLATDLKAEQAKGSEDQCRIAIEQMGNARVKAADGIKQMNDARASICGANAKTTCSKMQPLSAQIANLTTLSTSLVNTTRLVDADCKKPFAATHDADLTKHLNDIEQISVSLQQAVDTLKRDADKLKQGGGGIWIEAEDDTSNYTVPVNVRPARNSKEAGPSWRPPYFGSGDWYLAAKGEWLGYPFKAPIAGTYNVWIRDYVDKYQARGIRRIIVSFDGKTYGTFPETTVPSPGDKGAFGWHKVGSGVFLTAGEHALKITKEDTTRGAAILDAYYLTTGDDIPPEK